MQRQNCYSCSAPCFTSLSHQMLQWPSLFRRLSCAKYHAGLIKKCTLVFLHAKRRANIRLVYIIYQQSKMSGFSTPSFQTIHQTMDSVPTENAPRESDTLLSYNPTDPNLRDSPALVHLQQCILQVAAQAVGSGHSLSLVQSRLSQHQTQFDAFSGTLDGLFRSRDADLTTTARNVDVAAASFDVAQEEHLETISRVRHTRPLEPKQPIGNATAPQEDPNYEGWRAKLEQQTRGVYINAAAPLQPQAPFARTPQFGSGNPGNTANHTQNRPVAAQQSLNDEDWRVAHFVRWLETIPEPPDNIAHQIAQSGHDIQNDTKPRGNQPDDHDRGNAPANQLDGNSSDPPSIKVPTRTKSESDLPPPDEFAYWSARVRREFRRDLNPRVFGESGTTSE